MDGDIKRIVLPAGQPDIPAEVYHADPCETFGLSAGLAWTAIDKTPLHAWTASPRLNPWFEPEEKTAFDIGSAAHELLTGKGRGIYTVPFNDYRTKAAQEQRDQARADGYTPLTEPQTDAVEAMMEAARLQMAAHGIGNPFKRGKNEITLLWKDEDLWNRALVDCLDFENRVAYDYKTSTTADAEEWVRRSMDHGIDLRQAHYLDGIEAVLGHGWTYRFVVQEKTAPFALAVIELGTAAQAMGQRKLARARAIFRYCLESNVWPGYSTEIAVVEPPVFFESRWLERESREEEHRRRTKQDILDAWFQFQAPAPK